MDPKFITLSNPTHPPKLDKKGITYVQSITGTLLYYARFVNPTMITPLNQIDLQQEAPTTHTLKKRHVGGLHGNTSRCYHMFPRQ